MSNLSWSGLIQPDDPRYESWLLIGAFLQGEESDARAEFLSSFQKNGTIGQDDVFRLVVRLFDSCAKGIVITVNGTRSAEQRARSLDELLESFLDQWREWFLALERLTGMVAADLEAQTRLLLTTRCAFWKAQAFHLALETQIAGINRRPRLPATSLTAEAKQDNGRAQHTARQADETNGAVVKSEPGAGCDSVISPGRPQQPPGQPVQSWEDIEIRFLSDERVQIFICGKPGDTKNFAEMGFEDHRGKSGKPNRAWHFLLALAKSDGRIPATAISGRQEIQKRAQTIRQRLCRDFHIAKNPLPFVEGTGYRARFKITPRSPAYRT